MAAEDGLQDAASSESSSAEPGNHASVDHILTQISARHFPPCNAGTNALTLAGGILQQTLAGLLILVFEHEPNVAVEPEHAFTSAGAHAWVIGSLHRAIDPVKSGGRSAAVVSGDARQPGGVQLVALLRDRSILLWFINCALITEGEFAQVPHVDKPAPPSKLVQVIEEILQGGHGYKPPIALPLPVLQMGAQER